MQETGDRQLGLLFFVPKGRDGSIWYRLLQPAHKLDQKGLAQVCTAQIGIDSSEAIFEALKVTDVLIYSNPYNEDMPENFYYARKGGKKVVVDMNRDIFNISPFSPHYGDWGIFEQDITTLEGEEVGLWRDGITRYNDPEGNSRVFSIDRNFKNVATSKEILSSVDLITVTTPYLAELYGQFGLTKILPDYVDLAIWKPLSVRYPEDYFRLGWRGGSSHYDDLALVIPALQRLFKKYDRLKIVMSGYRPKGFTRLFPQERIELHPFMGHPAFPWHMMALGIHGAFYPWKSMPFNLGKNHLCWIEWSAMEVPGVYPGFSPYTDHVVNGETGLLAVTEQGWLDCLDRLIWDRKLRRLLGNAARAEVEAKWDINKNIDKWLEAYEDLFKEDKKCLTKLRGHKEANEIASQALH